MRFQPSSGRISISPPRRPLRAAAVRSSDLSINLASVSASVLRPASHRAGRRNRPSAFGRGLRIGEQLAELGRDRASARPADLLVGRLGELQEGVGRHVGVRIVQVPEVERAATATRSRSSNASAASGSRRIPVPFRGNARNGSSLPSYTSKNTSSRGGFFASTGTQRESVNVLRWPRAGRPWDLFYDYVRDPVVADEPRVRERTDHDEPGRPGLLPVRLRRRFDGSQ